MLYVLALGFMLALVVMMLRRTQMPPVLRSVLAVVFGFFAMALAISLCTMIAGLIVHPGTHPPAYLAASAGYSVAAALLGGWVAGDIAPPTQQLGHGVALAVLIVLFSLPALLHPAVGQPAWLRVFLATVPPVAAIAGAALAPRRWRI